MKYLVFISFLLVSIVGKTQNAPTEPPYKRFPTVPPIQLLLGDSITKYNKENIPSKKPVLIMLFSPDCNHCQHTAEEMYQNREALKDIHIVMATLLSLSEMNAFMKKYKLNEMKNVVAGKDVNFVLPPFYAIKNFPYMAMYNKKGNLILGFEGSMPIAKVIKTFKDNK
jgi:thioredoxin-related protein